MSLNGRFRAELQQARREQLRREQQRDRAWALTDACRQQIAAVTDPAIQQLAAEGLKAINQQLAMAENQITGDPDEAIGAVQAAHTQLQQVLADAQARAQQWNHQQAQAAARMSQVQSHLLAARQRGLNGQELADLQDEVARATALQQEGRYGEAEAVVADFESRLEGAEQERFDESVRREVVKGLLATLKDMGFVVDGPQVESDQTQAGVVTLSGRMPSGREARFEVQIDGSLAFDFEGYQDRACGKDLQAIEATLQQRFAMRLTPPQITWKNPDRIAKGARRMPGGAGRTGHAG